MESFSINYKNVSRAHFADHFRKKYDKQCGYNINVRQFACLVVNPIIVKYSRVSMAGTPLGP